MTVTFSKGNEVTLWEAGKSTMKIIELNMGDFPAHRVRLPEGIQVDQRWSCFFDMGIQRR